MAKRKFLRVVGPDDQPTRAELARAGVAERSKRPKRPKPTKKKITPRNVRDVVFQRLNEDPNMSNTELEDWVAAAGFTFSRATIRSYKSEWRQLQRRRGQRW